MRKFYVYANLAKNSDIEMYQGENIVTVNVLFLILPYKMDYSLKMYVAIPDL